MNKKKAEQEHGEEESEYDSESDQGQLSQGQIKIHFEGEAEKKSSFKVQEANNYYDDDGKDLEEEEDSNYDDEQEDEAYEQAKKSGGVSNVINNIKQDSGAKLLLEKNMAQDKKLAMQGQHKKSESVQRMQNYDVSQYSSEQRLLGNSGGRQSIVGNREAYSKESFYNSGNDVCPGFTEAEFRDSLEFLDFSFKLEQGLSSLKSGYLNIACLDLLSLIVYSLIFRDSPFFFWLSMLVRPTRGFIGFYLAMVVPRTDELIDRIEYTELKTKQPEGLRLIYAALRPTIAEQTHRLLTRYILEYETAAKLYYLLSCSALLVDIIGFIIFCSYTIIGQGKVQKLYLEHDEDNVGEDPIPPLTLDQQSEKDAGVKEASIAFSQLAFVCGFIVLDLYMIFLAIFQRFVLPEKERVFVPKVIAGFNKVLESDAEWKVYAEAKSKQRMLAEAAKQANLAAKMNAGGQSKGGSAGGQRGFQGGPGQSQTGMRRQAAGSNNNIGKQSTGQRHMGQPGRSNMAGK